MPSQTQFLERHGNRWRVQMIVPRAARAVLGKSKLVHSLGTDSLTEANRLKWPHIARFKGMIATALLPGAFRPDELSDEAVRWREIVRSERQSQPTKDHPPPLAYEVPLSADDVMVLQEAGLVDERETAEEQLAYRAHEVERQLGIDRATAFHRLASGRSTPLKENVEIWLAQRDLTGRTRHTYRLAVSDLAAWCSHQNYEQTVEAIDRRTAGQFISESLKPGRSNRTVNKAISALSSYWKWMRRRGFVADNPWSEQSLPKVKPHRNPGGGKRPYTDDEIIKLLSGPAKPYLSDLMRIAALSGMRIEEICPLRVGDCADGVFNIDRAKTPAGRRGVPIHSVLMPIIQRRCKGKRPTALLFSELPPVAPSRKEDNRLSDPVTKAFTRYRRQVGVDEVPPGAKQSNVDFHSFRRWFIDRAHVALQAGATGFTPWTVADVVGHDREAMALGMTFGHYAGPSQVEARRACVEAVTLPDLTSKKGRKRVS